MLNITDAGDNPIASVNIPGGGGGDTTNPTAIEITIQSALNSTIREGASCTVEYLWRHYNINNNVDTQYGGTAELIVGGAVVDRKIVTQGYNSFEVGQWLQSGLNTVRIRITADDGLISQSANIKITAAALSLRSLYDISTANILGSPSKSVTLSTARARKGGVLRRRQGCRHGNGVYIRRYVHKDNSVNGDVPLRPHCHHEGKSRYWCR